MKDPIEMTLELTKLQADFVFGMAEAGIERWASMTEKELENTILQDNHALRLLKAFSKESYNKELAEKIAHTHQLTDSAMALIAKINSKRKPTTNDPGK